MTAALRFDPIRLPPECEQLRKEVRAFLAEEIAAGVSYLASEEAAHVTGCELNISGGLWMR